MKIYWERIVSAVISVALVIPIAPVLFAVLGSGVVAGIACVVLGMVTAWAVLTVVCGIAGGFRCVRDRRKPVEYIPFRVPQQFVYDLDWTTPDKDDKL